ncbi:hypothetical protein C465_05311 [Halorubrum distributum JCM 9100]|uniref:Uncharacterized protein n=2 Tax=Halorubrum distributum TaxID=29283 RepID=M0EV00_9EURY|nr:hypothetical protein [Halorubrum distributum]ELZ50732.1 hypothetical protein C465_05311 [Halorubrum distributum JCM 9100]ELZ52844.1 hypothetical protein C466_09802 [Halorubrum distributum JCM 10118]
MSDSPSEFAPKQVTDADLHEITVLDDQNLLGRLEAAGQESLKMGEIVSPILLADLTETFEEEFGETDARLSFVEAEESGTVLVCLRPWDGDGTEAVVMPAKVDR